MVKSPIVGQTGKIISPDSAQTRSQSEVMNIHIYMNRSVSMHLTATLEGTMSKPGDEPMKLMFSVVHHASFDIVKVIHLDMVGANK